MRSKKGTHDFGKIVLRTLTVLAAAWAMLLLPFWLPRIKLDSPFSAWVVGWTHSGDVLGIVFLGLTMATLLSFRKPLPWRRRLREFGIHILVLTLLQGGGAWINEFLIKPSLAVPRPNIAWLAEEGALGMTAEQFYDSMGKHERQTYLEAILIDPDFDAIALRGDVREHWIHEAGYSLPSGHAFSAMLFATYFLAMGIPLMKDRRRWIFTLLPWWAVGVGWSRVLLRVHRPEDVVSGGLLGITLGLVAIVLSHHLFRRLMSSKS